MDSPQVEIGDRKIYGGWQHCRHSPESEGAKIKFQEEETVPAFLSALSQMWE